MADSTRAALTTAASFLGPIGTIFSFLGLLGGNSADKAQLAIQKAQFALQMAKSADDEKVARRRVKRASDEANILLAKSNLRDQYEASMKDLSDKGDTDAQRISDDLAAERTDIGREYLGGGGDPRREEKLELLKTARKEGMLASVGTEADIAGQFSGMGGTGVPTQWENAVNAGAKRIYGEMEKRAGLTADLTSPQDADLMTTKGGTKLEGSGLAEEAMGRALDVDYNVGERDIGKALRLAQGVGTKDQPGMAQKEWDLSGYTLPETVLGGIDPGLTENLARKQSSAALLGGTGSILQSMSQWPKQQQSMYNAQVPYSPLQDTYKKFYGTGINYST